MDANFWVTVTFSVTSLLTIVSVVYHPVIISIIVIIGICISRYWRTFFRSRVVCKNKFIAITGCDSGFGYGLAQFLDRASCTVIAGCLYPDKDGAQNLKRCCSEKLCIIELDVTSNQSVKSYFDNVQSICGNNGLWGLVNNAGMQYFGEVEFLPLEYFQRNMDVNYFGMVRMCQASIPMLRRTKGRIINVTSVLGLYAVKYRATYSPTKYAAEAFSDILRREMKKFGISVAIVEPGDFGDVTNVQQAEVIRRQNDYAWNQCSEEIRNFYTEDYIKTIGLKHSYNKQKAFNNNIDYVLQTVDDALFSKQPKTRYLIDGRGYTLDKYCWAARFVPFIPDRVLDTIVERCL
ncbi:retinol dehydrogenase 16 isoform X2 [Patella vulgata]|nr:retinol dehydrogenase 16 isoform X2 [Patella vulgata]XP_050391693.1 retinol dehydrogenase 16 isoform X2 [Patella vulgata]